MSRFNGINHLALVTGDMDRTIHFWRDLLELRMVAGIGQPGYRHYFFEVSANDLIAFFEWPDVEPLAERDHGAPIPGKVGFDHVSLGVDTAEELWRLKDRLDAAGFWTSEVVDHGFIHSLYSFDPNNIPIEFSYSIPGKEIRRTPLLEDRSPTDTALEGAEPRPERWPQVTRPTPPSGRRVYPGFGSELFSDRDAT